MASLLKKKGGGGAKHRVRQENAVEDEGRNQVMCISSLNIHWNGVD